MDESTLLQSPALAEVGRNIAADHSVSAENQRMLKEMGFVDENGRDASGNDSVHQAHTERIQKVLDKVGAVETPIPSTNVPGITPPAGDSLVGQAVGGAASALQAMGNAGFSLMKSIDSGMGMHHFDPNSKLTFADDYFPHSADPVGGLVRGVSQFATGYAAIGAGLTALHVPPKIAAGAAPVLANFLAFEHDNQRISNLIQDVPHLANPVTAYLAAKPTDSEAEGRFKNALEGIAVSMGGGAVSAVLGKVFDIFKFTKAQGAAKEALTALEVGPKAPPIETPQLKVAPLATASALEPAASAPTFKSLKDVSEPVPPKIIADAPVTKEKGGGYMINSERISAPDDTISAIKQLAEQNKGNIEASIKLSKDELIKQSGITPESILSKKITESLNEEEMTVLRSATVNLTNQVKELAVKANGGDSEAAGKMIDALYKQSALYKTLMVSKARAGRVLQSFQKPISGEEYSSQIGQLLDMHKTDGNTYKLAQIIEGMPPQQIAEAMSKTGVRRVFDAFVETRVGNLLSNVKTHVTNFTSSPALFASKTIERQVATIFGTATKISAAAEKSLLKEQDMLLNLRREGGLTAAKSKVVDEKLLKIANDLGQPAEPHVLNNLINERQQILSAKQSPDLSFEDNIGMDNRLKEIGDTLHRSNRQSTEVGEAGRLVLGAMDGLRDVVRLLGRRDFEGIQGQGALIGGHKEGLGYSGAITSEKLGGGKVTDILGAVQRAAPNALNFVDDAWKIVFDRAELHAQAHSLGVKSGFIGEDLSNFVSKMVQERPDFLTRDSHMFAQETTLTNPLEGLAAKFDDWLHSDSKMLGVPAQRLLFPFFRTPMNEAINTLDRTPLGALRLGAGHLGVGEFNEILRKGGQDAQLLKAKVGFGSAMFGLAGLYAAHGHITGAGPNDPKKQDILREAGVPNNSFKIGDTWYPLKTLGPIGGVLGMAADVAQMAASTDDPALHAQMGDVIKYMSFQMLQHSTPEGFIQNVGGLIDAIEKQDAGYASQVASTMVPLTGVAQYARDYFDPVKRLTFSEDKRGSMSAAAIETLNQIKNKIPYYSASLPPARNRFGEPIAVPNMMVVNDLSAFFSNKKDQNSPLAKELVRLGYYGPLASPDAKEGENFLNITYPSRTIKIGEGSVALDANQYSRYMQLAGGHELKSEYIPQWFGKKQTLREAMTEMVTKKYPQLSFDGSSDAYEKDQNKRNQVVNMIQSYEKGARVQLVEEFPELAKRLDANVSAKGSAKGPQIDVQEFQKMFGGKR